MLNKTEVTWHGIDNSLLCNASGGGKARIINAQQEICLRVAGLLITNSEVRMNVRRL